VESPAEMPGFLISSKIPYFHNPKISYILPQTCFQPDLGLHYMTEAIFQDVIFEI
jgi:hypothetical protein